MPSLIVGPETVVPADADFVALGRLLWRYRWLIAATGLVGLALAAVALHAMTFRYTATLQLTPTEQAGNGIARNISGLASLAGVNLPKAQVSTFPLLLETLNGRDVAAILARDPGVMTHIFAGDWDARTRTWREPPDGLRGLKRVVKAMLGIPVYAWHRPDAADLQEYLGKRLGIGEDTKRSIATISFSDSDPSFAGALLAKIVDVADERLRQRALARTGSYIAYIQTKLRTIDVADYREALIAALSDQEKQRMMASSDQPFAADPFGSVAVSERPTSPVPAMVLAIGLTLGLVTGVAIAWLRRPRRVVIGGADSAELIGEIG